MFLRNVFLQFEWLGCFFFKIDCRDSDVLRQSEKPLIDFSGLTPCRVGFFSVQVCHR